jgi:hypothetical protein
MARIDDLSVILIQYEYRKLVLTKADCISLPNQNGAV